MTCLWSWILFFFTIFEFDISKCTSLHSSVNSRYHGSAFSCGLSFSPSVYSPLTLSYTVNLEQWLACIYLLIKRPNCFVLSIFIPLIGSPAREWLGVIYFWFFYDHFHPTLPLPVGVLIMFCKNGPFISCPFPFFFLIYENKMTTFEMQSILHEFESWFANCCWGIRNGMEDTSEVLF